MNSRKGFIQIPILIALIIGVFVIGGAGYVGVKQYKNHQAEIIAKEQIAQEQEKITQEAQRQKEVENAEEQEAARNLEIENLKREVEGLKKSQTKMTPAPANKQFSTSEIVLQNKKYIVYIFCQTGLGDVSGSGIIIGKNGGSIIILTNYHITKYAKIPPAGVPPCFVHDSVLGESYYGQPIYYPSVATQNVMEIIDFSFIEIKDPVPLEILDLTTGKLSPGTPKTDLLSTSVFPKICDRNLLKAGAEIVVLGFPAIGGDSILPGVPNSKLITTEGIISHDVFNEAYFVTSAKIEQGNSGGGAFLRSSGCLAGMPTFSQVGEIESLGRLMNLPRLRDDYLSKIF